MSGYLASLLVLLAINTVFAYGAYLPLAAGQLNIGLAGFAAIGAYGSGYLSNQWAIHPLLAIPLGAMLSGGIALIVAVPVLRTSGIYLALATFALGQITRAVILNLGAIGGAAGYPVASFIPMPVVLGFAISVAAFVSLLFATRFGLAVRAVHDDPRVADLMGIGVRAVHVTAFTLGAIIAGIGGGLYAHHFSYIEAQYFNVGLSITIVLYVLLGGTQTAWGPFVGAAIFTLLPELLRQSASFRYTAFAAGVIVLMALRPQGLVTPGLWQRLFGLRRASADAERSA